MAANVSGAVLASLFHEHSNSSGDQEGFLLGQIVSHVKDTITDSQISGCKVETVTNVYSFIPCLYSGTFYDRNGDIIKQKLDSLLQGRTKELVGWYRFRRNSSSRMSMKENCLHHKLLNLVDPGQQQHFLFCLSTDSTTNNTSTHSFDHCFQVLINSAFRQVPLSVINLGYSMQEEYKHKANMAVNPSAGVYHSLISKFVPEFSDDTGEMFQVKRMHCLAEKLQSQLQLLCSVVNDSEQDLQVLENELTDIRKQVEKKREQERPKQPLPPTPGGHLPVATEGPPPYPGRENPPIWEPLFIHSRKEEMMEERQKKSVESVHVPLLSIDIANDNGVNPGQKTIFLDEQLQSLASDTTTPPNRPSDVPLQPQKQSGAMNKAKNKETGDNSDSNDPGEISDKTTLPLERTNSLPSKSKEGQMSSDHFSFIDSVLQQAKSTTPARSASVRTSRENRKSQSLDEPDPSSSRRANKGPDKPARTFQSSISGREKQMADKNVNSNTSVDDGPPTIDRHDRLRCKPVQRTRSRAQAYARSKSNDSSHDSVTEVAGEETVSHHVDGQILPTAESNVSSSSPTGSICETPQTMQPVKTRTANKKSRTRAEVQAERAAAAKSASGVCSVETVSKPVSQPTILGAASGSTASPGNGHEGTSEGQSPSLISADLEQLQCNKGSSSPVF